MEVWFGKPATDYDSLHVFGSAAYYHITESKLDPRAKKATFMGIASGSKGYRLWCPKTIFTAQEGGYRIIGNMGDQGSNLIGINTGNRTFKLPDLMYYIS
ncbi:hypothetical protein ACOSQ3_020617 [Xanthoceras sorbifolium]